MKCLVALALCGALGAQLRPPAELQQELTRMRKQLSEAELLERRLLDMRIDSDLGLVVDVAKYVSLTEAERGRGREAIEAELGQSREETAGLQTQLAELGVLLETRRQQLVERAQAEPDFVARPSPAVPPAAIAVAQPAPDPAPLIEPGPVSSIPHATSPIATEVGETPAIDYIKGSRDHSKVGRALFRAALYEKAIVELTQAVDVETPELIDLFYLARCHEKTGALDKADDLFARVEALDSKEGEDGKVTLGGWASAAHTARQHMSWQRDRGDWAPKLPIDSIQWKRR